MIGCLTDIKIYNVTTCKLPPSVSNTMLQAQHFRNKRFSTLPLTSHPTKKKISNNQGALKYCKNSADIFKSKLDKASSALLQTPEIKKKVKLSYLTTPLVNTPSSILKSNRKLQPTKELDNVALKFIEPKKLRFNDDSESEEEKPKETPDALESTNFTKSVPQSQIDSVDNNMDAADVSMVTVSSVADDSFYECVSSPVKLSSNQPEIKTMAQKELVEKETLNQPETIIKEESVEKETNNQPETMIEEESVEKETFNQPETTVEEESVEKEIGGITSDDLEPDSNKKNLKNKELVVPSEEVIAIEDNEAHDQQVEEELKSRHEESEAEVFMLEDSESDDEDQKSENEVVVCSKTSQNSSSDDDDSSSSSSSDSSCVILESCSSSSDSEGLHCF